MEKEPKEEIKEINPYKFIVPECCREGWESCKHVINKDVRNKKKNVGM